MKFRLLKVDLSNKQATTESIEESVVRNSLGGASLAAEVLSATLQADLNPLSPEAPLLIFTGPLTGTTGPAVGRFVICAKSPATGLWGESNIGGHFGPELRKAGFEGIWITGRAESPTYLHVHDGEVSFQLAGNLWGITDTYETQARIKEELGDPMTRVASIGIAGEREIPFSVILCDHGRVAGRTGMGAVMGSKLLKAIAVRGSGVVPIKEPERFAVVRRAANLELRIDSVTAALRQLGSASGGDYFDYLGEMPKRYFTRGKFPGAEKTSGATLSESLLTGVSSCHGCVIACGRRVKLRDGVERKGPEYETMVGFGPNLEIDALPQIVLLGELCDRYGLDTISMSNTIGLVHLMLQEGHLPEKDLGGLRPSWGDPDTVESLIHLTARKEGIGALMAQGALALAEAYGVPDLAVQVNGLEVAYHDPRGASGMALVYATSPRGACHNQSDYFMVDIGQTLEEIGVQFHPRQAGAEKSLSVARHQDWRTLGNALVLCHFANVPAETVVDLVNLSTGFEFTLPDLVALGERAWNLKRVINLKLGLTRQSDRLPKAFLDPLPDGGSSGYRIPFQEMLTAYYTARGWDRETGIPLPATLKSLDLDLYLPDLWPAENQGGERR